MRSNDDYIRAGFFTACGVALFLIPVWFGIIVGAIVFKALS